MRTAGQEEPFIRGGAKTFRRQIHSASGHSIAKPGVASLAGAVIRTSGVACALIRECRARHQPHHALPPRGKNGQTWVFVDLRVFE
jgi:hypothetical protein